MDGKEAIIAKIIESAENKARDNVHAAEEYAVSVKEQATEWAKSYSDAQEKALKKETADIVDRRKIVAGLDVRKALLKARQDVINGIYERAEQKLCKVDKKTYLKLVLAKISEFADEGDEVVLSCDGVISEKDILDSAVCKEKRLTVCKKQGKFYGGVMLVGKTCDKNLTFHEIISVEKERTAPIIAKEIFG
ncbi:MAG: V-type ATP synthase subunit E [Clostridia bacterium]|nr:V-type ATP synthase subunit E [Clostridia bacterium]